MVDLLEQLFSVIHVYTAKGDCPQAMERASLL